MLIIGSNYEADTGRTSTRLSTVSAWDPLPAMQHDVVDLESTFRTRGYHVETMPHECFDRQGVLDEVARFLQCALPGDVRAIVFTGHSTETSEGPPAMVLPGIHSEFTITSQDWNRNIRANARPGVIVVSILATCFAGGFVDQGVRITDFAHLKEVEDCASFNAPILVTFSSSGSQERSYESPIHEHEPRDRDHFLWALATTAREPSVRTWQQFNTKLRDAFALARTAGSMYAGEGALRWMWDHPQCPVFATTTPGFIPPLHSIFPVAGKILA
ncbi:hypothetical protein FRC09_010655 [Ceratobasidium sp. 395]|nr:hypothetical protein FRC09_010655 [Ceratobasidium sp. 395]